MSISRRLEAARRLLVEAAATLVAKRGLLAEVTMEIDEEENHYYLEIHLLKEKDPAKACWFKFYPDKADLYYAVSDLDTSFSQWLYDYLVRKGVAKTEIDPEGFRKGGFQSCGL